MRCKRHPLARLASSSSVSSYAPVLVLLLVGVALTGCIGGTQDVSPASGVDDPVEDSAESPPVVLETDHRVVQRGWWDYSEEDGMDVVRFEEPVPSNVTHVSAVLAWEEIDGCPPEASCEPGQLIARWVDDGGGGHWEPTYVEPEKTGDGFQTYVYEVGEHLEADGGNASESGTGLWVMIATYYPDPVGCDQGLAPTHAETQTHLYVEAWEEQPDLEAVEDRAGVGS